METKRINYLMIIFTLFSGLIGWIIADYIVVGLIYSNANNTIPNTVCMGIYYSILAVFGCVGVILSEIIHPTYNLRMQGVKSSFSKRILISIFAVSIIAVMLFSMAFQFLYEITVGARTSKNSIIFVMDCSGSLESGSTVAGNTYAPTDKDRQRITAAKSIIDKMDNTQYCALVSFTDVPVLEFQPAVMSGDNKVKLKESVDKLGSNGENNIKSALDFTYKNVIEMNKIKNPVIILFTDGEDNTLNEANLDKDINNYIYNNIPIYSVEVNQRLNDEGFAKSPLDKVAKLTAGQYIAKKNADQIADAFTTIYNSIEAKINKNRVLIFKRDDSFNISQLWFFVIRVLCYIFIAALIGLAYTILLNSKDAIITNIISGLVSGIIMEVGCLITKDTYELRLITAIIMVVVINRYILNYQIMDPNINLSSNNSFDEFQGFGGINDSNDEFNK